MHCHMNVKLTHHVSGTDSVPAFRPDPSKTQRSDNQYRLRNVAKFLFFEQQYLQWPEMYFACQSSEPNFLNCHGNMSYWLSRLQSVFIENVNDYVVIFCTVESKPKDGNRSCSRNTVCSINLKKLYTMENVHTVNEFQLYITFFSAQHMRKKRS
jgi:hypothetical protein